MTDQNEALSTLLKLDPIAEAEKATGKSYKADESTLALGVLGHIAHGKAKKDALSANKDTYYNSPWKYTEEIIDDLGFEQILVRAFLATNYDEADSKRTEYQVFYWRKDGILLKADTYGGENGSVNSMSVYYNIECASAQDAWEVASSGHFHRESYDEGTFIWVGNHDVREGLRHKLAELEKAGTFLPVWIEDPFLYLHHYGKTGNVSVVETLSLFPEEVQKALVAVDRTKPFYNEVP